MSGMLVHNQKGQFFYGKTMLVCFFDIGFLVYDISIGGAVRNCHVHDSSRCIIRSSSRSACVIFVVLRISIRRAASLACNFVQPNISFASI